MSTKTLLAMGLCAGIGLTSITGLSAAAPPERPEWVVPATAAAIPNPNASDAASISRGRELYQLACLACHGGLGRGDGPAAAALERHPGVLSDSKTMWQHTDGAIFWKVSEGRPPMPAFKEALAEKQLWDIVNYVRTLAPKPKERVAVEPPVQVSAAEPKVAQQPTPASSPQAAPAGGHVSREEYDKLRGDFERLQIQMQEVLRRVGAPEQPASPLPARSQVEVQPPPGKPNPAPAATTQVSELASEVKALKKQVDDVKGGTAKHLFSGYAFAGYTDRKGESGTFNAGANPIFHFKPVDRLFFGVELELGLAGGKTEVGLEYAHLAYFLNDYVTLDAGQFLSPFGIFSERQHPAWINKLPDAPLAFGHEGGIVPPSILGAQIRGGVPVGQTRLHYSLYLGNGPTLNTGAAVPDEAGMLHFNNYDDFQNNKVVGGRLGFLPFPELEIGYSGQFARVDAKGTSQRQADARLHGPYLSYVRDSERLKGVVDVKAEWAWSMVDRLTYDPTGALGFGPLTYDNRRSGGYAQLAYRPSKLNSPVLKTLEGVFRFDRLDRPSGAPESADESRYTFGLNYWFGPSAVFKAAYQFGDRKKTGLPSEDINAFLIQTAIGF